MIKMGTIKEKLENVKLEVLFMIVLLAIVLLAGIAIFGVATKNKKVDNFKEDAISILSVAKNVYPALEKSGKTNHIITSEDGTATSVCMTLTGLQDNNYLTKEYKDWSGYVVVEKQNENYTYTLWGTNNKYVLNGYTLEEIENAKLDKEITTYTNEEFERQVKTSYEGKTNKKYNNPCISKKVE
jgi:hypothetical protein